MKGEAIAETAFERLNPQHQGFVLEYIDCRIGEEAYRRVYGKRKKITDETCRKNASRLLTNADIKTAISEKLNEIWAKRTEDIGKAYDELSALAFSDIRSVMNFAEDGTFSVSDLSNVDTRAVKKMKIRKEPSKKIGNEVVEGADIIEIELYDKKAALAELAEVLKMKEPVKLDGTFVIKIDNDDNEL